MANNITILDSSSTGQVVKTTDNAGVHTPHHNVDSVPTDPFGANADAASATGSISAKLRAIASTGIPVTGSVTVLPTPTTSGGLLVSRDLDLDNGALTVVKASAGQMYGFTITNRGTVPVYVKFYDAASGTLGTGTPVMTIEIPGNATDHTTIAQSFGGLGIAFATGICVGAGTGIGDADNTDPGANIVLSNVYYK